MYFPTKIVPFWGHVSFQGCKATQGGSWGVLHDPSKTWFCTGEGLMSSQDECQIAPSYQINVGGGLVPFIVAADITQVYSSGYNPEGGFWFFSWNVRLGKEHHPPKPPLLGSCWLAGVQLFIWLPFECELLLVPITALAIMMIRHSPWGSLPHDGADDHIYFRLKAFVESSARCLFFQPLPKSNNRSEKLALQDTLKDLLHGRFGAWD